jgi:hypothetical protein
MFKKVIHIGITALLVVSTTGLTIHLHYCKDKLYDVGVFSEALSCCGDGAHEHSPASARHQNSQMNKVCGPAHRTMDGCDDKTVRIRPVDDFMVISAVFDFTNDFSLDIFAINSLVTELYTLTDVSVIETAEWSKSPPGIQTVLSLLQTYLL